MLSWGWLTAVTFFLTPFLIARLGTDYYGLYVLITSISGFLGLADLGLAEATLRYVAYYFARQDLVGINRAMGATLSVYLVTGCLGGLTLIIAAPWIAELLALPPRDLGLATSILRLMAISFGLVIVTGAYGTVPKALQRYDIDCTVVIGQSVLHVVGTAAILLAGLGLYELVLWSVASTAVRQMANIIIAKRLIPSLRLLPSPSRAGLKEVFSYGIFSSLTQAVGMVATQTDRLLLGTLVGASAVAYLNVPKSLVRRGSMVTPQASDVLFPRFSAAQNLAEERRLFLDAVFGMLCTTILIFVPATVLLPDFLRLWVGEEFARESAQVGQLLAFGAIARGAFVPSEKLFKGRGKPQYVTAWYLTSSVIITGLNILLIGRLGLKGAGYASIIELVVPISALLLAWRRVLRSDSWRPLARAALLPFLLSLICLALAWMVRSVSPTPSWIGLLVLEAVFVMVIAVVVFGADLLRGGAGSHARHFLSAFLRLLRAGRWRRWRGGAADPAKQGG